VAEPSSPPAAPPRAESPAPAQRAPAGLPEREPPAGTVTLPAKLGAVTFDHKKHVGRAPSCATCHHESRPEKPLEAQQQACRDCHTQPAVAPMKTSLRDAHHDAKASAGTCVSCHKQPANQGKPVPLKCADCHKKAVA
jgi:hypothetical protein